MQSPPFSVGSPIKARCTKCRKNAGHIIVTLNDGDPGEVQCDLCGRQHSYRPPSVAKKRAPRQTAEPRDAERKEWQELRPSMRSSDALDYSMNASYRAKALINHPVFGLGLVQRVVGPQKIEVLFEDGRKRMRCK